LLERARDWAVETRARGLVLSTGVTNKAAQALYESCGWARDDEFHRYRLLV
jgi:GNAT superfamily N-acetyltransferase